MCSASATTTLRMLRTALRFPARLFLYNQASEDIEWHAPAHISRSARTGEGVGHPARRVQEEDVRRLTATSPPTPRRMSTFGRKIRDEVLPLDLRRRAPTTPALHYTVGGLAVACDQYGRRARPGPRRRFRESRRRPRASTQASWSTVCDLCGPTRPAAVTRCQVRAAAALVVTINGQVVKDVQ